MKKRILTGMVLGTILLSNAFAVCTAQVNTNRPTGLGGGSYDNCTSAGCHPTVPGLITATRHHVIEKDTFIERLNKAFSDPQAGNYTAAENKIVEILNAMRANNAVIQDFQNAAGGCNNFTNSYLTWLAPNLVLGPRPSDRTADPGNAYDIWVSKLIPNETNKNALEDINKDGSPNQLAEAFSLLEVKGAPYDFVGTDWTYDNNKNKYCTATEYQNNGNNCPLYTDYS